MDPEDDAYESTLTEASLAKAVAELHEDPRQRLGAVQTLRQWIKEQPHFLCRTDTDFLLQILRTAKFSQLRAREIIVNIMTMRTKCPQFMVNLDSQDPVIIAYLKQGPVVPLPKPDKQGRYITIIRGGVSDINDKRFTEITDLRASLIIQELLREHNENYIVNGVQLVFDLTGVGPKHLARINMDNAKNTTKIYQECNPGRVKGFHIYNGGSIFEIMMNLMKPFSKKKVIDRMHVHPTMESMYDVIPMELWPVEYLPDDYIGPSAGSIRDIVASLLQRLSEPGFRARLLDHTDERYKMTENVKPVSTPQESFRKLNID